MKKDPAAAARLLQDPFINHFILCLYILSGQCQSLIFSVSVTLSEFFI
jgi:hypothetical protein